MKYIIIEDDGIEVPIIFSELLKHIDVKGQRKVISAGFCQIDVKTILGEDPNGSEDKSVLSVNCGGKSVGLGVKSRAEDAELIKKHLNFRT